MPDTVHQSQFERIPSKELAGTSKLNALWEFANYVFDDRMQHYPEMGLAGLRRFEQPQDFIEEMGPRGVTFIQYAPNTQKLEGSGRIIGTAGCKPFSIDLKMDEKVQKLREEREKSRTEGQESSVDASYSKAHDEQTLKQLEKIGPMVHNDWQDDVPRWEVMTVCVHPEWQKQGLADKLMDKVVEEVGSQVKSLGKGPDFKLVVRIVKEINEKYWLRKRFKPVGEKFFEAGIFGSPTGFHIMDMTRDYRTS